MGTHTKVEYEWSESFSALNKCGRLLWTIAYRVLFRPSPFFAYRWRNILLALFGANIGKGCRIYPGVNIWAPWNLKCGDGAAIGNGVTVYNHALIEIGDRTVISQGAHLCSGTRDYEDRKFRLLAKPVIIGNDCWIAAEAFILPGVKIGNGAVIGARSLVSKDMPEWSVCAGNPCRKLKERRLGG